MLTKDKSQPDEASSLHPQHPHSPAPAPAPTATNTSQVHPTAEGSPLSIKYPANMNPRPHLSDLHTSKSQDAGHTAMQDAVDAQMHLRSRYDRATSPTKSHRVTIASGQIGVLSTSDAGGNAASINIVASSGIAAGSEGTVSPGDRPVSARSDRGAIATALRDDEGLPSQEFGTDAHRHHHPHHNVIATALLSPRGVPVAQASGTPTATTTPHSSVHDASHHSILGFLKGHHGATHHDDTEPKNTHDSSNHLHPAVGAGTSGGIPAGGHPQPHQVPQHPYPDDKENLNSPNPVLTTSYRVEHGHIDERATPIPNDPHHGDKTTSRPQLHNVASNPKIYHELGTPSAAAAGPHAALPPSSSPRTEERRSAGEGLRLGSIHRSHASSHDSHGNKTSSMDRRHTEERTQNHDVATHSVASNSNMPTSRGVSHDTGYYEAHESSASRDASHDSYHYDPGSRPASQDIRRPMHLELHLRKGEHHRAQSPDPSPGPTGSSQNSVHNATGMSRIARFINSTVGVKLGSRSDSHSGESPLSMSKMKSTNSNSNPPWSPHQDGKEGSPQWLPSTDPSMVGMPAEGERTLKASEITPPAGQSPAITNPSSPRVDVQISSRSRSIGASTLSKSKSDGNAMATKDDSPQVESQGVAHPEFPLTRDQLSVHKFVKLRTLGSGAAGTVYLAMLENTNPPFLYAIKEIDKQEALSHNHTQRVMTEREIFATANHPFIVSLYASFQTKKYLYFVMEYCHGGELFRILQKQHEQRIPERAARFYAAETLLALEYLHSLGFIYRDLKPENIMMRLNGHLALTDFDLSKAGVAQEMRVVERADKLSTVLKHRLGLGGYASGEESPASKLEKLKIVDAEPHMESSGLKRSNSLVGTVEYLSPEVILLDDQEGTVDWWTLGILIYEMICGFSPFSTHNRNITLGTVMEVAAHADIAGRQYIQQKLNNRPEFQPKEGTCVYNILHHEVVFPRHITISQECKDLIRRLLKKNPKTRLGHEMGASEIKSHKWFADMNFALIRNETPPIKPVLGFDPTDLSRYNPMPLDYHEGADALQAEGQEEPAGFELPSHGYNLHEHNQGNTEESFRVNANDPFADFNLVTEKQYIDSSPGDQSA